MVCSSHVGFRVEGVLEANLTSDVSVACLFQGRKLYVPKCNHPPLGGVAGRKVVCRGGVEGVLEGFRGPKRSEAG